MPLNRSISQQAATRRSFAFSEGSIARNGNANPRESVARAICSWTLHPLRSPLDEQRAVRLTAVAAIAGAMHSLLGAVPHDAAAFYCCSRASQRSRSQILDTTSDMMMKQRRVSLLLDRGPLPRRRCRRGTPRRVIFGDHATSTGAGSAQFVREVRNGHAMIARLVRAL